MKKLMLILMLGIVLTSFVVATEDEQSFTWKKGETVNYSFRCFDGVGDYCASSVVCSMNIEYPNGTNAIDNASMDRSDTAYYYVMDTTTLGEYYSMIVCDNSTTSVNSAFTYLVTTTGARLDSAKSYVYIGLFGLLIFLFVVNIYAMGKIPDGKVNDMYGNLIGIGNIKYVRNVLFLVAWGILIATTFLASNIALAYMETSLFGNFFFTLYRIMFLMTLPMIVIWFIFLFVGIFRDKETTRMIERGIWEPSP